LQNEYEYRYAQFEARDPSLSEHCDTITCDRGYGTAEISKIHFEMPEHPMKGCTLKVSHIPREMDLGLLRSDMDTYGKVLRWVTPPGPVHVYVVYETSEMASAAMIGLREHRRLVVAQALMYG
jgi:hypothetical protein